MSEEKESSMNVMKDLNAEAYTLESDLDLLRKELKQKEAELLTVNNKRNENQRLMDEVDQRFAETLLDLQTREREVRSKLKNWNVVIVSLL